MVRCSMITRTGPGSFFSLRTSAAGSPFTTFVLVHAMLVERPREHELGQGVHSPAIFGSFSFASGVGQYFTISS